MQSWQCFFANTDSSITFTSGTTTEPSSSSTPLTGPGLPSGQQLGAPAPAAFRLIVIDRPAGSSTRIRNTYFLSPDLKTLTQAQREADYDPRSRPWYRGAFEPGASAITDPYLFGIANLTGYTVRAPFTAARRGIVAGDILLADVDAFLRAQKLGQSGVVFLFDDSGRLIAHPRMSEFLKARSSDATADLPRLDQVEAVDISVPLTAWRQGGDAQQLFEAKDGRTYVAAFRSVETAGSANLRLAVVAPLDEFFSEVEAARRRLLLLATRVRSRLVARRLVDRLAAVPLHECSRSGDRPDPAV